MITVLLVNAALAQAIDPDCQDVADGGPPADYSEQGQQDFLLNYFALATTFSPLHAPIPHEPGKGSIGLEIAVIPPLSCERRLVLGYSKTEDTNKAPAAPRPRVLFSFPRVGPVVPYAGAGYVPPVTVFGTRNVIASGELGVGVGEGPGFQWGGRYHYTLMKTIGEIATPFEDGGQAYDEVYIGSTFGVDLMAGWRFEGVTPYLSLGFTDASTFFYIGDDGVVGLNASPYAGGVLSAGAQGRVGEHVQLAGELYAAPGYIYTGRLRGSWVF